MKRRLFFVLLVGLLAFNFLGIETTPAAALNLRAYPVIPVIRGSVYARARALLRKGRTLGNRADVFSKIGDSITAWPQFLVPVGTGGLRLGSYTKLQGTFDFFTREVARTNNSFANESLGAYGGWTSFDVLNPAKAAPGICAAGTTPIDCELGVTKPAVALIMIGTNDLPQFDVAVFRANLNQIVNITEAHGVIPVISTLPRRKGDPNSVARIDAYNQAIVAVARAHNAPLWNYWLAMEDLPQNGISIDLVHPSEPSDHNTAIFDTDHLQFGWNMRNLTAMQVLNGLLPVLNSK